MTYYNKDYFNWQKNHGAFGGVAELFKFKKYILSSDKVIDFGCGGGFLLANIKCKEKIGIEINPDAREQAKANGINVVASTEEIENEWADVIISNHALEHTHSPLEELKKLKAKLKVGGKIIFVTPYERRWDWTPNDINQHLFTWSPMNLGNLFSLAGFKVQSCETLKHRWPPYYLQIRKVFGEVLFDCIAKIYSQWKRDLYQVQIIATK